MRRRVRRKKNTLRGASVAGRPKVSRGAERSKIPSGKKASPFYPTSQRISPYSALAAVPKTMTGPAMTNIFAAVPVTIPSACVKIGHIIFLLFSNYRIQSNGNQLFLLKDSSSGLPCNCFYNFFGEIILTLEINLYSSIFIDTDFLYQFPKVFWAVLIQKLNTLGICF